MKKRQGLNQTFQPTMTPLMDQKEENGRSNRDMFKQHSDIDNVSFKHSN
jgi:hypothetical protein